jgi:glycosyltransferase involved in cell wall biosynthesis
MTLARRQRDAAGRRSPEPTSAAEGTAPRRDAPAPDPGRVPVAGLPRRIKVLVLDHATEAGGGQLAMTRLASALEGHASATFVLPEDGSYGRLLRERGLSVRFVPLNDAARAEIGTIRPVRDAVIHGRQVIRAARAIARLAREENADVLYCNSLKAHVYGAIAARIARRGCVLHIRDILAPPYLPPQLRRALAAFYAVLPPAAAIANSRATAAAAPLRTKVHVIPSGITRKPSVMPAPPGGPTLAVLGRLTRWKGQDVAVRAMPSILERFPTARLIIGGDTTIGDAEYARELHRLPAELGVDKQVRFTGFVDDPYAFFAGAHVALHTSVFPEPFGQVIVEALAVGRPVIATAGGGPSEILADGRAGTLVVPGDPSALADAVVVALERLDADGIDGKRSHDAVRTAQGYTLDRSADLTLDVLQRVVAAPALGRRLPRGRAGARRASESVAAAGYGADRRC